MLAAILTILFGGLAYRVAGSEITGHDSDIKGMRVAKLALRSLPMALAAWLFSDGLAAWYVYVTIWAVVAAADSIPHSAFQGEENFFQIFEMGGATLLTLLPLTVLLYGLPVGVLLLSFELLIGVSVVTAVGGWLAQKIPVNFSIGPIGFHQGAEIGEVAHGALRLLWVLL